MQGIVSKKKHGSICEKIAILLYLLVPYTCSIFPALFGRFMRSGDMFIISMLLVVVCIIVNRTSSIGIYKGVISACLIFLIPIINMLIMGIEIQNEFLQYVVSFLIVVFFGQYLNWQRFTLHLFQYVGIFYAVTVVLQIIIPVPFYSFAMSFFPDNGLASYNLLVSNGYASGLTSQSSIVCCYLIMGIASIISQVLGNKEYHEKIRITHIVELGVLIVALLLTGKRGHLVFTLLALFVVLYLLTNGKPSRRLKLVFGVVILLALFYVSYIMFWQNSDSQIFSTINRLLGSDSLDSTINGRTNYYELMWKTIADNGLFGIGWDHFRLFSLNGNNGHNIYLQVICELGFAVGISYILILRNILRNTIKKFVYFHRHNNEINKEYFINSAFVTFSLVFYLAYGFTGNPLYDTEYIAFLTIIIAMFLSLNKSENVTYWGTKNE